MSRFAWAESPVGTACRTPTPASAGATVSDRDPDISVTYQPILDVARGVAAGYQALVRHRSLRTLDDRRAWVLGDDRDGHRTASALSTALSASSTLPTNTFLSAPLPAAVAGLPAVREILLGSDALAGVVLDVIDASGVTDQTSLAETLATYRRAGALISLGGHGSPQPELSTIVRLKPSIVRLGRDWVRGIDASMSKRSAIEVMGALTGQLDAWILAEGVTTSAELRTLATLSVPLAQGPLIGEAREVWSDIPATTRRVLPNTAPPPDGALRELMQSTYTAADAAAATAVPPETTGFDVVVVVDDHQHPVSVLERDGNDLWTAGEVLAVNINTAVNDTVARAMARPRGSRFTPLVCTDDQGTVLGVLRIERLMEHLNSA